jgi:hypothetical protein
VETQLGARFDPAGSPLMRATLAHGPPVSELILAVHRSIGDRISAMYLVRDLLESLEGYRLEELPPRPSVEEMIGDEPVAPVTPARSSGDPLKYDRPGSLQVAGIDLDAHELEKIWSVAARNERLCEAHCWPQSCFRFRVRCLAPVNVRSLFLPIEEDFGRYISSGTAGVDGRFSA